MKRTITRTACLLAAAAIVATARPAHAAETFAAGVHGGFQHDVGNFAAYNPAVEVDPENTFLLGASFFLNYGRGFFRFGFDTTILFNRGRIIEDPGQVERINRYAINYTALPAFIGIRFDIFDRGAVYLGAGATYFLASGRINFKSTDAEEEITANIVGYGFILGGQINLTRNACLYLEWQYVSGRSQALLNTSAEYTWYNLALDMTGNRYFLGCRYYLF